MTIDPRISKSIDEGPATGATAFPIAPGVNLILRYPANLGAMEGGYTLLASTEVLAGALATLHAKDSLYGGAWREQGWMGNLARIMSKTARLRNMLWQTHTVDNEEEPVKDTIQDLINLCVFMMLNRQSGNRWGKR